MNKIPTHNIAEERWFNLLESKAGLTIETDEHGDTYAFKDGVNIPFEEVQDIMDEVLEKFGHELDVVLH